MPSNSSVRRPANLTQALILEMFRTVAVIESVAESLLEDLADDAFPGEDSVDVLFEMIAGSAQPAIAAAGGKQVRTSISLICSVRELILSDLKAAADLAARKP